MTVTRISSPREGSITAPKIIFASLPASSNMIFVAASTSKSVRSALPVIFTNTPCAPLIEASSNNGLDIAC